MRVAAQKILGRHLKRFDPLAGEENYWPWMAVDLSGAALIDLDFRGTGLTEATFEGAASFREASFHGQFRATYTKSPGAVDLGDAVFNPEFEPPPGWEFGARNAEGLCPLVRSTGEAATP